MLNIDNYRLKIGSQNYYFDCSENRESPPRVPLALFGFQKPLANSGGNPNHVASRRAEFFKNWRLLYRAVSPEQNPNFFPKQSERGLICAPRPLPAVAGAKTKNFPYLSSFPRRGVWGEPTKNGKEIFGFCSCDRRERTRCAESERTI